jgi:gliding motility-associated-like protein
MKNIFLILFLFFLWPLESYSQCPSGKVILSSQESVDEFIANYGSCTEITGDLEIISSLTTEGGGGGLLSNITDLSQLNFIERINGKLSVIAEITELTNFNTLQFVGGDIEITNCNALELINDFNNLTDVRSVVIALNSKLKSIKGFNLLEQADNSIELGNSPELINIEGFTSLKNIEGELNISKNPKLIQIPAFNNLVTIGDDLNFTTNTILPLIDGFNSLISIGNDLNVESVNRILGFNNLKTIVRFFDVSGNGVEEIPSFNKLETIGAGFRIRDTNITNIIGFNLLQTVGNNYFLEDWFILSNNPNLNNVSGFSSFILVDGFFQVINNPAMSDCSWMCYLFNNGEITKEVTIQNNLGDCSSAAVIIEICDPDFDNDGIANVIDLDDDNDGILDVIENSGSGFLDFDNDGFPNSKDLDSDNDGCFDVIESGFNDPNSDGVLGDLPDTVDFNGLIINETTGYTTPLDSDSNSVFDFLESSVLNPGENNILEVCLNNPIVDLFTALNGTPEIGGTWSPPLSGGNGIFNPATDTAGIYTYTHFNAICGNVSAEIKVEFPSDLNSGFDAEIITCIQTGTTDLFTELGGNPTPGGIWLPELTSGTGVFDPNIDLPGIYTYSVTNRDCGTVSSSVKVDVSNLPNAGISSKIFLCEFSQDVDLFTQLGGNPDEGGVWSSNLTNTNGIFSLLSDSSNVYVYTVDNGSCGFSSSTVEVEIIRNTEISNVNVILNDFSNSGNSIEIEVYSNRIYEYSMDGINYQLENIFNDVSGGPQKVFVRGADGCQFFSKEIFVRTYPHFFTPNLDGVNDSWNLKDFPDINYTIYIYNRFGTMIKTIVNKTQFWDGKKDGLDLPSSNYWFKVVIENGETLHGNFSLLR